MTVSVNMKDLDLITITYNDGERFLESLRSVDSQTARHRINHIVVDSNQAPLQFDNRDIVHITTDPRGVYNALNIGIKNGSSDIIGMLHGNDLFASEDVIETVLNIFQAKPTLDFLFADLEYFSNSPSKVTRRYKGNRFSTELLVSGYAPPHPTLFLRRKVFDKTGFYDESFRIAGDFEFWLRLFDDKNGFNYTYVPKVFTLMSQGGLSSSLKNQLTINFFEKRRALKMHGIKPSLFKFIKRLKYL